MQSEHLERGSRKIEILYLEAKLQLQPAAVRCRIAEVFETEQLTVTVVVTASQSDWWAQNRYDILQLNKLLEFGNFGGAICLDLADQLKNAILRMIGTSYEIDFLLFPSHIVLLWLISGLAN